MTGTYLDALIRSRMCIKERYVQATTGLLERAEALEYPVCTASVSTAEQNLKREPYDGAAVGSKHALAKSFKPISSAKGALCWCPYRRSSRKRYKPSYSCFREWGSSISNVVNILPEPLGRPIISASHAKAIRTLE
jgi:hypothetical protein